MRFRALVYLVGWGFGVGRAPGMADRIFVSCSEY